MRAIVAREPARHAARSCRARPTRSRLFRGMGEHYKVEIIEGIPEDVVSLYRQGDFVDLCRGPHVPSTGRIAAFRLTSVAGAYWRGDCAQRDAPAHLRDRLGDAEGPRRVSEAHRGGEAARPPPARPGSSTSSRSTRSRPGRPSSTRRAPSSTTRWSPTSAACTGATATPRSSRRSSTRPTCGRRRDTTTPSTTTCS